MPGNRGKPPCRAPPGRSLAAASRERLVFDADAVARQTQVGDGERAAISQAPNTRGKTAISPPPDPVPRVSLGAP